MLKLKVLFKKIVSFLNSINLKNKTCNVLNVLKKNKRYFFFELPVKSIIVVWIVWLSLTYLFFQTHMCIRSILYYNSATDFYVNHKCYVDLDYCADIYVKDNSPFKGVSNALRYYHYNWSIHFLSQASVELKCCCWLFDSVVACLIYFWRFITYCIYAPLFYKFFWLSDDAELYRSYYTIFVLKFFVCEFYDILLENLNGLLAFFKAIVFEIKDLCTLFTLYMCVYADNYLTQNNLFGFRSLNEVICWPNSLIYTFNSDPSLYLNKWVRYIIVNKDNFLQNLIDVLDSKWTVYEKWNVFEYSKFSLCSNLEENKKLVFVKTSWDRYYIDYCYSVLIPNYSWVNQRTFINNQLVELFTVFDVLDSDPNWYIILRVALVLFYINVASFIWLVFVVVDPMFYELECLLLLILEDIFPCIKLLVLYYSFVVLKPIVFLLGSTKLFVDFFISFLISYLVWCFAGLIYFIEVAKNVITMLSYFVAMIYTEKSLNEHQDIHDFLFSNDIYQLLDIHKTQMFFILILQYYFFRKTIPIYIGIKEKVIFFYKNFKLSEFNSLYLKKLHRYCSHINLTFFNSLNMNFNLNSLNCNSRGINKAIIVKLKAEKYFFNVLNVVVNKITNDPIYVCMKNNKRFKWCYNYFSLKFVKFLDYLKDKINSLYSLNDLYGRLTDFLSKNKNYFLNSIDYWFALKKQIDDFWNNNKTIKLIKEKFTVFSYYYSLQKKTVIRFLPLINHIVSFFKSLKGYTKSVILCLIILRLNSFFFFSINFFLVNDWIDFFNRFSIIALPKLFSVVISYPTNINLPYDCYFDSSSNFLSYPYINPELLIFGIIWPWYVVKTLFYLMSWVLCPFYYVWLLVCKLICLVKFILNPLFFMASTLSLIFSDINGLEDVILSVLLLFWFIFNSFVKLVSYCTFYFVESILIEFNEYLPHMPVMEKIADTNTIFCLTIVILISNIFKSKNIVSLTVNLVLTLFVSCCFLIYLELDTFAAFLLVIELSAIFFITILLNKYKYNYSFEKKINFSLVVTLPIFLLLMTNRVDLYYDTVDSAYFNYYQNNFTWSNTDFFGIAVHLFTSSIVFYGVVSVICVVTLFITVQSKILNLKNKFSGKYKDFISKVYNSTINYNYYSSIDEFFISVKPTIQKWFNNKFK